MLNLSLEFIGVHEIWRVFRLKLSEESLVQKFLYVSIHQDSVPACVYEVQMYKKNMSSNNLYQTEYLMMDFNMVTTYAVIVERPSCDLESLFKIWSSP